MGERRVAQLGDVCRWQPEAPARGFGELGDSARVPGEPGRLEVGEVAERLQRRVERVAAQPRPRRLSRDDRLPALLLEALEDLGHGRLQARDELRIKRRSGVAAQQGQRRLQTPLAVLGLEPPGHAEQARGERYLLAGEALRDALAVPARELLLQRLTHRLAQSQPQRKTAGDLAVRDEPLHHGAHAAERE